MRHFKLIKLVLLLLVVLTVFSVVYHNFNGHSAKTFKVGVIVPVQHQAMDEIVAGFKDVLRQEFPDKVTVRVFNAQGDINLMRAGIAQMRDEGFNVIAPISTTALQMTLNTVRQQAVVGVAALYSADARKLRNPCNVTNVEDQLSVDRQMAFIHAVYPQLNKIALVHSSSEKIFDEVELAKIAAAKYGINIDDLMIQNLNDLYSVANVISADTDAIFILKDGMVVSGIATLVQIATTKKIPLITSDDGSVQHGAAFALAVHECSIGESAARVVIKILRGTDVCKIDFVKITRPVVFINAPSAAAQGLNVQHLMQIAKETHYATETLVQNNDGGVGK